MIRRATRVAWAGAALGATAVAAGVLFSRRSSLAQWETLTCEDCEEGGFITLADGAQVHYVARGNSGSAVILIHGLMSSTQEWARNIDALAEKHQVWAIDLIGFGYSTRMTEPIYSLKFYARTVREFMDAVGIERAHMVGHSLGGAIALQFAHDYPARLLRLVLVDPAAYIFRLLKGVRLVTRVPYLPRVIGTWLVANPHVHRMAFRNAFGDARRLDPDMLASRVRASRVRGTVDALLAMTASPDASNIPEGLKEIAHSTIILWGDRDYVLPSSHARRLARDLPNAELVIVEGAGHVPNEEFPEVVNRLMLEFMGSGEEISTPEVGADKVEAV